MITKTIKYHDLDGDLREDQFYFSLNQTQMALLNAQFPGGIEAFTLKAAKDKNADEMFRVIHTLVKAAYGERVGNAFTKKAPNGQDLSDFFVNTEAYDNLMTELTSDEDTFINFMSDCLNKEASDRVKAEMARRKAEAEQNGTALPGANNETKPSLSVLNK